MFLFFHHLSVTEMVDEIFVHQKHTRHVQAGCEEMVCEVGWEMLEQCVEMLEHDK